MSECRDECGVVVLYHLPGEEVSPLAPDGDPNKISRLIPRMLLDLQNRGQLAAGITVYNPEKNNILNTYKDVGMVTEVFQLSRRSRQQQILNQYEGPAAIGHVRYATCGSDDPNYAQPFERKHLRRYKWFSFCFNGQIANYQKLRDKILDDPTAHLSRDTDAELILYYLSTAIAYYNKRNATDQMCPADLLGVFQEACSHFDGAYTIAYLDAMGNLFVGRDPQGMKPLCYAIDGPLFAAASESNALLNLGIDPEKIKYLGVGELITIMNGKVEIRQAIPSTRKAHCFFEWIYFANVASTLETRSVYLARKALGEVLADMEDVPLVNFGTGERDLIVVPVPDTSKAAAAAMAYKLGVPCLEGLIHNRYVGRTFIEGGKSRMDRARMKYTPLREVLEGKRILLVDDSIVRSTTMVAMLKRIREVGKPKEIHVRITCPPVIAPCFYGVDMPTVGELFAPQFLHGGPNTAEHEAKMAEVLGADSLRFIPVESIESCIGLPKKDLCCACVDAEYPTPEGIDRYHHALHQVEWSTPNNACENGGCDCCRK